MFLACAIHSALLATSTDSRIGHLAKRARGKHARDGTKYGRSRTSARSFYVHHTQRLSMAAACGDVHGIFDSLRGRKQRAVARDPDAEAAA